MPIKKPQSLCLDQISGSTELMRNMLQKRSVQISFW